MAEDAAPSVTALGSHVTSIVYDRSCGTLVWTEADEAGFRLKAKLGQSVPRDLPCPPYRGGLAFGGGHLHAGGGHAFLSTVKGDLVQVDLGTGELRTLTTGLGDISSPRCSPQNDWVLLLRRDCTTGVEELCAVSLADARLVDSEATGHFFRWPRWAPSGEMIAFVTWDHTPWQGCGLWLAEFDRDSGAVRDPRQVAGGPDVFIGQPEFSLDGSRLAFVSDEHGGELHLLDLATGARRRFAEGRWDFNPTAWVCEQTTIGWVGQSHLVLRGRLGVRDELVLVDVAVDQVRVLATPGDACIDMICPLGNGEVAYSGSSTVRPSRLMKRHIEAPAALAEVATTCAIPGEPVSWLSDGIAIEGLLYRPGATPGPTVVMAHGGPQSQYTSILDTRVQFLTGLGMAVLLVNYRGSTGYRRAFRDSMKGRWGEVDVADVVAGAQWLVDRGIADPGRMVAMGNSAGGFTSLLAVMRRPDVFAAAVSLYGVTDLSSWRTSTHQLETSYTDWLIGPYPGEAEAYRSRSPCRLAGDLCRPVALFQGTEDRSVPAEQATSLAAALARAGKGVTLHLYEGQEHGWSTPSMVRRFHRDLAAFLADTVLDSGRP